jgi:hypothetical protein
MNVPLPFFAKLWVVGIIFIVFMVLLDLILVRWRRISAVAWKRVDYIWLGFAALGLIGAVAQSRQLTATNFLPYASQTKSLDFRNIRQYIEMEVGSPAICRTFTRTQYSPPPEEAERILHEYNRVCEWFNQVSATFPKTEPSGEIPFTSLPASPEVTLKDLRETVAGLRVTFDYYNERARYVAMLRASTEHSDAEQALTLVSPLLLAFALALRITKVTGEVRLELKKKGA